MGFPIIIPLFTVFHRNLIVPIAGFLPSTVSSFLLTQRIDQITHGQLILQATSIQPSYGLAGTVIAAASGRFFRHVVFVLDILYIYNAYVVILYLFIYMYIYIYYTLYTLTCTTN